LLPSDLVYQSDNFDVTPILPVYNSHRFRYMTVGGSQEEQYTIIFFVWWWYGPPMVPPRSCYGSYGSYTPVITLLYGTIPRQINSTFYSYCSHLLLKKTYSFRRICRKSWGVINNGFALLCSIRFKYSLTIPGSLPIHFQIICRYSAPYAYPTRTLRQPFALSLERET